MSPFYDLGHFGNWSGPGPREPVPVGARCVDCNERIEPYDEGYIVRLDDQWRAQHRHHRREDL